MTKQQTKTKFKQTEIGMIPEEWAFDELEKHATLTMGQSPESIYYNPIGEGTLFLQGIKTFGHLHPKYDTWTTKVTKLAKKGSVLLSVRAPVGEVNIADKDICIGRGLMSINGENNTFIFYLLKAFKNYVVNRETGTVYGSVTRDDIAKIRFPFPPLPEQRAIAKILSDLDAKIELNQQMNKTLEAIGQAIFKHWFVDFEFPNEEGKPYKSSGGEMVYNEELGKEIPKGWNVKELKEIVSRLGPGTNFQPKRTDVGIPFLNVKNISNGFLDLSDVKYISKEDYYLVHKSWKPEEHDILISRIGTLGNVAVIRKEDLPLSVHYNIIDIKPRELNYAFLYFLLTSQFFQKEFHLRKVQTVQEYITIENVEKIKIALPDNNFLKEISKIFLNLLNKMEINYTSARTLSSLRDSLLPKLMSGKIRVPVEEVK